MKIKGNYDTRNVWIDDKYLSPTPSQAVKNHSPDGFAWGNYGGSGPSQLALAILLECTHKKAALKWYQNFKQDIICALPPKDFKIKVNIKEWISNKIKEESFKNREN